MDLGPPGMGVSLASTCLPLPGFWALVPFRSQPLALGGAEVKMSPSV